MNLGTLQMYRENSVKSLEYNSEALRIYEVRRTNQNKVLGHDHPVVAVTYMNLGTLQMYRENSVKSLEYNSEALPIYEVRRTNTKWQLSH